MFESFLSMGAAADLTFSQAPFYPSDDHVFFAPNETLIRPRRERVRQLSSQEGNGMDKMV